MIYISAIEIIPFNIYLFLENIYFQIQLVYFTLEKRKNKSSMIIYLNNIIKID